jgi:GT2 family glycosyltransferase
MFDFPDSIAPYGQVRGRPLYRLQGMESMTTGSGHLNFAYSSEAGRVLNGQPTLLPPGAWIGAGTFRNSFYVEPWAQLSSARDMYLVVDFVGALRLRVTRASRGRPNETLHEVNLQSATRSQQVLALGSPGDAPEASRVFWHIEALDVGAQVHDVAFCSATAPRDDCRMAVLLRTFGRTSDIKALLRRFLDAAGEDHFYARMLDHMHFWVLDTTAGSETAYEDEWLKKLNVNVLFGPNLGGGGNAGHLIKLFEDAADQSKTPPTEVLILDDDLSVSMETLSRYFMFVAYRASECLTSLPVLMKSRPTVVWEDGGFWGRLNFHEAGDFSRKRNMFPALLKHGLTLDGFEHLDQFSPLNTCEYSTFIFFGLSMKSLRKVGFPAAFFLRGDDIEMSLRAQESGLMMITNPNLAAWHEPAHSYGQEYMAILHGIIINFSYSEHGADFYVRFFEERMHEHASIDDGVGLGLYLDILTELLDPKSQVLTHEFQHHYLPRLKALGAAKFTRIPDADRENFERRAREEKTLIVPFVYPGFHQVRRFRNVVLVNHSLRSYREITPLPMAQKVKLLSDYMALLARLQSEFPEVQKRWQERLKSSAADAFWTRVRDDYAKQTRTLATHHRNPTPSRSVPVVGTVATSPTLTTFAAAGAANASQVATREPAMAVTTIELSGEGLPLDFDAEFYLVLNPDVKASGVDAGEHYRNYGRNEGRRYRL